jgi:hypothetical protein
MTKLAYKLLIFCSIIATQNISFTQTKSTHKLQMGIILASGLNFNKMSTKIAEGKMGTDLSIGMNIIKNFNDNLGLISGFEFDFSRINYTFIDTVFYAYTDSKILNKSDNHTNSSVFKINERNQTPIYLSIPTMFVFRTDYMGYNRYFAKFGMRHSFALKSTTVDKGVIMETKEQKELPNMELSSDLSFYKGSIGIACGTEWNYYGTSTMAFEIGYYYGINNIHRNDAMIGDDKDKNRTLYQNLNLKSYTSLKNTQNQITFKVSFLF